MLERDFNYVSNSREYKVYWICKCICGTIKSHDGRRLRNGSVREDCGCIKKGYDPNNPNWKQQNKRFKNIWKGIKERCYNSSHIEFFRYGAMDIIVCDRWLESFENFKSDMFESYVLFEQEFGLNSATIDRIDSAGNYEPANCRWLTLQQQARNRKDNIETTVNGKTYGTIMELSEDYSNIRYDTIKQRYRRGLRGDDLIATRRELWEKKQVSQTSELGSK